MIIHSATNTPAHNPILFHYIKLQYVHICNWPPISLITYKCSTCAHLFLTTDLITLTCVTCAHLHLTTNSMQLHCIALRVHICTWKPASLHSIKLHYVYTSAPGHQFHDIALQSIALRVHIFTWKPASLHNIKLHYVYTSTWPPNQWNYIAINCITCADLYLKTSLITLTCVTCAHLYLATNFITLHYNKLHYVHICTWPLSEIAGGGGGFGGVFFLGGLPLAIPSISS